MHCIADLASVTNGRERDLVDVLYRHYPDVRSGTVTLLVNDPNLFAEFRADVVTVPDGAATERDRFVIENVDEVIRNTPDGEQILVGSFRTVLGYHLTQKPADGRHIEFLDFRHLLRIASGTSTSQLKSWPTTFMPLTDALKNLETAVQTKGVLKQTQLRPALAQQNPAWKKVKDRNAPQDDPKIISIIVGEGVKRGIITASGPTNDPYLSVPGTDVTAGHAGAVTLGGQTTQEEGVGTTGLSAETRLSDRILKVLRAGQLGPYQEVRVAVYNKMEEILKERSGEVALRDLISEAVDSVRESIEEARRGGRQYLIRSMTRNLPWGGVKAFITLMMTRTPVAIIGGEPARADWT